MATIYRSILSAALFASVVFFAACSKGDEGSAEIFVTTPELLAPAANAANVSTTPEFTWDGEEGTFGLYVSSDNGATWTTLAEDLTETSYTTTNEQALVMNTLYLWQVSASESGVTKNSAVRSFRTVALPSPVVLSSPADNAVTGDLPVLTWEPTGTASYSVRVRKTGVGAWTTIATGLTEPEFTFADAEMSTEYEWHVLASDPANASLWNQSPVRKFTYMQTYADGEYYIYKDFDGTSVPGNGTPYIIVVMGDGFINTDYDKAGGFFDEKADFALDAMFNVEPFKSYKEYFKVYKLTAVSNMSGISKVGGRISDTKFHLQMPASGNVIGVQAGYEIDAPIDFTYENIPDVKPANIKDVMVMVLANSTEHGGVNWFLDNGVTVVITSLGVSYERTFVHESGHQIGHLGDEYITPGATMSQAERDANIAKQQANPWENTPNLDFTGDPANALWSKYNGMGYDVGYFEGGQYKEFGVWRSTEKSLMSSVALASPFWFNAISREAIVRRLMKLTGQEFDWDAFLAKDDDTKYVP